MNSFVNQFLAFHSIFGQDQPGSTGTGTIETLSSAGDTGSGNGVNCEDEDNSNSPPPPRASSSAGGGNNSDSDPSPQHQNRLLTSTGKQRKRFRVACDDDDDKVSKVFTDEIDELCQCTCLICNKCMTSKSLKEHIRKQHKMGPEEYISQFGEIQYTKLTYHRCHLCKRTLKAVVNVISNHLKKCHDFTFQQYRTKFDVFNGVHSGKRKFFIKKNSSSDINSDQSSLDAAYKHCQTKQQQQQHNMSNSLTTSTTSSLYAKLFANELKSANILANNPNFMTTNNSTNFSISSLTNSSNSHMNNSVSNSFHQVNSSTNKGPVKRFTSMALLLGNGVDPVEESGKDIEEVQQPNMNKVVQEVQLQQNTKSLNQLIPSQQEPNQSNHNSKCSTDFLRNFYFTHFMSNFERLNSTIKRLNTSGLTEEHKHEIFNTELVNTNKQNEDNRVHDIEIDDQTDTANFQENGTTESKIKGVMLGEIDDLRATPSPPSTQVTSADLINNNNSLGGVVSQHLQQQWLLGMQNLQNGFQGVEEGMDQDGRVYTNNVKDFCVAQCHLCNKKMTIKSLREHVRHRHNQSIREYKKKYGDMCYTKITYHRCKFCMKSMKASVSTISTHLKKQHSVSFQQYRALFKIFQDVKRRRRL